MTPTRVATGPLLGVRKPLIVWVTLACPVPQAHMNW